MGYGRQMKQSDPMSLEYLGIDSLKYVFIHLEPPKWCSGDLRAPSTILNQLGCCWFNSRPGDVMVLDPAVSGISRATPGGGQESLGLHMGMPG